MKKIKGYTVTEEVLKGWDERFVPNFDYFYFTYKPDFMETQELAAFNKANFTLDIMTAFCTWGIKEEAKYIGKILNANYLKLQHEQQQEIIHQQWQLGRGLIFTDEEIVQLLEGLSEVELSHSLEILKTNASITLENGSKIVMLLGHNWRRLSDGARKMLLLNYAELWTDEASLLTSLDNDKRNEYNRKFPVLFPYFDSFPAVNGPNCFATAIVALTNDLSYVNQWMKQDAFLRILEEQNYKRIDGEEVQNSDMLVWVNNEGTQVHAAFVLDEKVSFNKHGQTMFNPWQIIKTDEVIRIWNENGFKLQIYRR